MITGGGDKKSHHLSPQLSHPETTSGRREGWTFQPWLSTYCNYSKWEKVVLPKKEVSNVARQDLSRREPIREVKSRDPRVRLFCSVPAPPLKLRPLRKPRDVHTWESHLTV